MIMIINCLIINDKIYNIIYIYIKFIHNIHINIIYIYIHTFVFFKCFLKLAMIRISYHYCISRRIEEQSLHIKKTDNIFNGYTIRGCASEYLS